MNMKELLDECEKRAMALIKQGVVLKEFDMRLIARHVIAEAMEGKANENNVSM